MIGTPPNSILAGTVNELYGVQISFAGFMAFAAPLAVIMLFGTWVFLTKFVYKIQLKQLPGGRDLIHSEMKKLGQTAYEEKPYWRFSHSLPLCG
ncbi:anion permease [Sinobaca sp. H24]|uniref:anion permease n=1 Tax=Sinobaca sp. H24 TaxID=2923376 RepID=UPI0027E34826|nr:anion permease [Sinobaca sp. H24]